jgi:predicted RecA/RadA family phage recombinase
MKNFVQRGCTVPVQAPAGGAVSGQPCLIGALFGVAAFSAPETAPLEIVTEGVFDLPKATNIAFAQGDKAYWDTIANALTSTAIGHAWVAVVTQGALASASTVRVRLNHQPIS